MPSNLFLNRLVIYTRKGDVAYDEKFHHGVNIIAGDNSSGKSTISHFIFYVLGGAFNDWVKEAKQCSNVYAEVTMGAITFTLRREIVLDDESNKANKLEGIYIYWGQYEQAIAAPITDWEKYGYITTAHRKSFSNVFFENLNIPIVKGDNNITFHQLLRLMYVDQDSPTSSLFLYEQFDTTLTRETISDLLLGVYKQELYDSKQRLNEVESELESAKKEIKVIKQFTPNELDLIPAAINTRIDNTQKEIDAVEEELIQLREQNKAVRYTANTKLEFEKLNTESIKQREIVLKLEEQISALTYEIDDTKYFIAALETKKRAVKNSILTREFLGEFPLEYCPECLLPLHEPKENSCKLCKEPTDDSFGVTQAKKIEQELSFQIQESKTIIALRERQLIEKHSKFESEKIALRQLQIQVNAALKDVKSVRDEKIDALYVNKGVLEGDIMQQRTLLERAELYQSLVQKRDDLEKEKNHLSATINKMERDQAQTKNDVNRAIEKEGLYLLNNDLKRQEDFIAAREFNVDYGNNIAFISDKDAKYSASSNFYLKTSARYAIFLASLENERMRYPRFIICDNMEDKGIEAPRAQNFQKIIIDEAAKYSKDSYQIIYTTSFLSDELRDSDMLVGEYYTKDSPSLKNVESQSSLENLLG